MNDNRLILALMPLAKQGYHFDKREFVMLVKPPRKPSFYITLTNLVAADDPMAYVLEVEAAK